MELLLVYKRLMIKKIRFSLNGQGRPALAIVPMS